MIGQIGADQVAQLRMRLSRRRAADDQNLSHPGVGEAGAHGALANHARCAEDHDVQAPVSRGHRTPVSCSETSHRRSATAVSWVALPTLAAPTAPFISKKPCGP